MYIARIGAYLYSCIAVVGVWDVWKLLGYGAQVIHADKKQKTIRLSTPCGDYLVITKKEFITGAHRVISVSKL